MKIAIGVRVKDKWGRVGEVIEVPEDYYSFSVKFQNGCIKKMLIEDVTLIPKDMNSLMPGDVLVGKEYFEAKEEHKKDSSYTIIGICGKMYFIDSEIYMTQSINLWNLKPSYTLKDQETDLTKGLPGNPVLLDQEEEKKYFDISNLIIEPDKKKIMSNKYKGLIINGIKYGRIE